MECDAYALDEMALVAENDPFLDAIMSRDAGSLILQREVDSVSVWLDSDRVGHIMRGNLNSAE